MLTLLLTSCNKLFFDIPMPIGSERIDDLPSTFLGDYLIIYSNENSLDAQFRSVTQVSNKRYLIECTYAKYLDSLSCIHQGIGPIKKVNVENGYLEIVTEDKIYNKNFADTLSSEQKKKDIELDFNEHVFYDSFESPESYKESKSKFELGLEEGLYFLNTQHFHKYWLVTKIKSKNDALNISTLDFNRLEENKTKFDLLRSKYDFKRIKFDRHIKQNWSYYLAKSDNEEMKNIFDEPFFEGATWYKINEESHSWLPWIIGFFFIITLAMLYIIRIKQA